MSDDNVSYITSTPVSDPSVSVSNTESIDADVARVKAALDSDCVYRKAGLSVNDLAKHLSIPEYRLRSLIHHHLGYRNFNALLHRYRVNEVCERLSDSSQNRAPVLTLALSAGYQSINPFNRAFRELQGMTPTEYRRLAQKNNAKSCNNTPNLETEP